MTKLQFKHQVQTLSSCAHDDVYSSFSLEMVAHFNELHHFLEKIKPNVFRT